MVLYPHDARRGSSSRASQRFMVVLRETNCGWKCFSHYATRPSRVTRSPKWLITIEIRHQPLNSPQIAGQHLTGLGRPERRFVANMADDARKWRCIEPRALPHRLDELDVVLGRLRSVQPQKCSEDDEDLAQARRQQLQLSIRIVSGAEEALS